MKSLLMHLVPFSALLFFQKSLLASGFEIVSAKFDIKLKPCDESYPLVSPISKTGLNNSKRRYLVAVPNDPSRRSYAPLCPDGKRIDIRQLVNCNAGSCFEEVFQQCTFECTWNTPNPPTPPPTTSPSRPPTRFPTPRPTYGVAETVHAVRLKFTRVPDGYQISPELRSIILRFTTEILENNLDEKLELVDVSYASSATAFSNRKMRKMSKWKSFGSVNETEVARQLPYTMFLPFRVVVKSTTEVSNFALSYIMEALRSNIDQLYAYLTSSYGEDYMISVNPTGGLAFDFNEIEVESYDFSDLTEMGDPPTLPSMSVTVSRPPPPTSDPTYRPTRPPSLRPSFGIKETVHAVRLKFTRVPDGFKISPELRSIILRFTSEILRSNLDERLELVEASFASSATNFSNRNWRKLDFRSPGTRLILTRQLPFTMSLPLRIVVKSNTEVSEFALSYIMEALRGNIDELDYYLKSSNDEDFMTSFSEDGDVLTFEYDSIVVESYDPSDLTDMAESPGPSPHPSPRPVATRESSHPLLLTIIGAPKGYRVNQPMRESILRLVSDSFDQTLDNNFVLVDVQYATFANSFSQNDLSSGQNIGELRDNLLLPIRVRIRGPAKISDDVALQFILQAMERSKSILESSLRTLKGPEFQYSDGKSVLDFSFDRISVDTYDSDDLTSMSYVESMESHSSDQDEGSIWWIWLIIFLLLICSLCICCAAFFLHRGRRMNKSGVKNIYAVEKNIKVNDSRSQKSRTNRLNPKAASQKSAKPLSKGKDQDTPPTLFDLEKDLEEANQRRHLAATRTPKATSHMSFHTDGAASAISFDIDPPEQRQRSLLMYTRDSPTEVTGVDPSEFCDKIVLYNQSMIGEDPSECVSLHGREPFNINTVQDDPSAMLSIRRSKREGEEPRGLQTESIPTFLPNHDCNRDQIDNETRSNYFSEPSPGYYGGVEPRGVKQKSFYFSNAAFRTAGEEPRGFKQKSVYFDSSSYYGQENPLNNKMNPTNNYVDASDLLSHHTGESFQSSGSSKRKSNKKPNHFIFEGMLLEQNNTITDPPRESILSERSSRSRKSEKVISEKHLSKRHSGRQSSSDTKSYSSGNKSFATKEPSLNSRATNTENQE